MRINLNDTIDFVLTEYGAQVWNEHHADYPSLQRKPGPMSEQLWEVMQALGPSMHNGGLNTIENNTITARTDAPLAVEALAAEANRLEAKLDRYIKAFARAQKVLLAAAEKLRELRPAFNDQHVNAVIDECSLAAMNPGVVEHSKPDLVVEDLNGMPWFVGAGRLHIELHALTDLLALARSVGAEVGTFTVHELARIAGNLHASSYVEHSIALHKIHALLNLMPEPSTPMPDGAVLSVENTIERVKILVDVLRKATDALVAGGAA